MYKSDHWKDKKENNTVCLWEENLMTRLKKVKKTFNCTPVIHLKF